MTHTQEQTTLAAVGMPLMDMFLPSIKELEQAEELIRQGIVQKATRAMPEGEENQRLLNDALDTGIEKLTAANEAVNAVQALVEKKGYAPGSKNDLDAQEAAIIAKHFSTVIEAAKAVNRVARWLEEPKSTLNVRGVGGTVANKLHGLQSLLAGNAKTHLIGMLGPEDAGQNRQRILDTLNTSSIDFQEQSIGMEAVPISYIISPPGGGDRIVMKAPIGNVKDKLSKKEAGFTAAITDAAPQWLLIEGSDISDKKLGQDAFGKIYPQGTMYPHLPEKKAPFHIAFALPTDAVITRENGMQSKLAEIISAKNTRVISGNEAELMQWFFKDNPQFGKGETPISSGRFSTALHSLQHILGRKTREPYPEPIAFISAGEHGAYAVTPQYILHVPIKKQEKAPTIVNTLGAGDAFFAGAFAAYLKTQPEKRTEAFSKKDLEKMLLAGHALAGEAIRQKHTQVPQAQALEAVHGAVPDAGFLAARVEGVRKTRAVA